MFDTFTQKCTRFYTAAYNIPPSLDKFRIKNLSYDGILIMTECDFYKRCLYLIIEPVHAISNHVVCATSKASDQPAHTRSLIRAFASR